MSDSNELKVLKRTEPWIPVGHPRFKWTTGADVQATWRKYGWVPPSEKMTPPPPERKTEYHWVDWTGVRRVK